jgi:hypothetical protein
MNSAKISYLYITGTGYSGSTLLAFLLDNHPEMISIGETVRSARVAAERRICSCGALFLQCPFFSKLEQQVSALDGSFTLTNWQTSFQLSNYRLLDIPLMRPLRLVFLEQIRDKLVPFWPGYQQRIHKISQRNVHLAGSAVAISGKKVFVDAQKDSIRIKFLHDIEQLDLRVIHLVRDVRGVVASVIKRHPRQDVGSATRWWYHTNMNSERARRYVSPDRWLRLAYDELCADPQGAMNRISDFMGVKRTPMTKDFYEGEHHILGNRMRLKGGNGVVEPDVSWKERLTDRDLDIIARIGGVANRFFGHDWP